MENKKPETTAKPAKKLTLDRKKVLAVKSGAKAGALGHGSCTCPGFAGCCGATFKAESP